MTEKQILKLAEIVENVITRRDDNRSLAMLDLMAKLWEEHKK